MMDLLGQKEMYKKLESFHLDEIESNKEFYNTLIKFVRQIDYFKQSVDSFMEPVQKNESKFVWTEEAKEFVGKTKNSIVKIQRFSDGIMIYSPLAESNESFPITSVFHALLCTASTMLTSLAIKNPIRVGIGLGGAVEIEKGELFGPAIGYAYEMESKRAIYPRIAIHEGLMEYLASFDEFRDAGRKERDKVYKYRLSILCREILKYDDDDDGAK